VSTGPLAVRWGELPKAALEAGAVTPLRVELENAGSIVWRDGIGAAYHWLDERDNPIFWDGYRTQVPPLAPGERAEVELRVRAPIPPGTYRLALDMVAEARAWFSELGSPMRSADVEVAPRHVEPNAELPPHVERAPDWAERVREAHARGYGVVAGAIAWEGGRRPRALAPYVPGPGRIPGFSEPLLCPSVAPGVELERVGEIEGLPAFAAPQAHFGEPWIYDGRIVLKARARSDRRPS
jgi:hypothetical protein